MDSLNQWLVQQNFHQLQQLFGEYRRLAGKDIEESIDKEVGGDIKEALKAVGTHVVLVWLRFKEVFGPKIGLLGYVAKKLRSFFKEEHKPSWRFSIIEKRLEEFVKRVKSYDRNFIYW